MDSREEVKGISTLATDRDVSPENGFVLFFWKGRKPMNVTLDPKDQKRLEELARVSGREPGEILHELLHEVLLERTRNGDTPPDDEEAVRRQRWIPWCVESEDRKSVV